MTLLQHTVYLYIFKILLKINKSIYDRDLLLLAIFFKNIKNILPTFLFSIDERSSLQYFYSDNSKIGFFLSCVTFFASIRHSLN